MHHTPNKHKSTQSPHYNMGIAQDIIHTVIIHFFDEIVLSLLKYATQTKKKNATQGTVLWSKIILHKGENWAEFQNKFQENSKLNSILEFWTHMRDEELHTIIIQEACR